jgi:hypothetical protein
VVPEGGRLGGGVLEGGCVPDGACAGTTVVAGCDENPDGAVRCASGFVDKEPQAVPSAPVLCRSSVFDRSWCSRGHGPLGAQRAVGVAHTKRSP